MLLQPFESLRIAGLVVVAFSDLSVIDHFAASALIVISSSCYTLLVKQEFIFDALTPHTCALHIRMEGYCVAQLEEHQNQNPSYLYVTILFTSEFGKMRQW